MLDAKTVSEIQACTWLQAISRQVLYHDLREGCLVVLVFFCCQTGMITVALRGLTELWLANAG
jgi:hypothetical protein